MVNSEISIVSKRLSACVSEDEFVPAVLPGPLLGADLTWNTERPSLTTCFRQTALVYLPLAAAAIVATLEISSLLRRPTRWDC